MGVEPKRAFAAAALKAVKAVKGGDAGLQEACNAVGLKAGSFLTADEMDPDAPSVEDWLASQGLSSVPL